jgi:hypothetical protein
MHLIIVEIVLLRQFHRYVKIMHWLISYGNTVVQQLHSEFDIRSIEFLIFKLNLIEIICLNKTIRQFSIIRILINRKLFSNYRYYVEVSSGICNDHISRLFDWYFLIEQLCSFIFQSNNLSIKVLLFIYQKND